MLKILNKECKDPQKKLISFQNPVLMDGMIKSEAAMYNTSDSFIVERTMTEHYLNTDDHIATAIASNLLKKNGIVLSLKAINQIYIEHPEYANETLLDVLRYASRLCQEYPSKLETTDDGVAEMAEMAAKMLEVVEKRLEADPVYTFLDENGERSRHVDEFDLIALRDVSEASTSQRKLSMENLLYLGINAVLTFWNFGGDIASATIKNWKGTYLFLDRILNLCYWGDYAPNKFEFSQIVKKVTFDKGEKGLFDASAPALSKMICLDKKIFMTTQDAVILHTQKNQDDRFFTGAFRVIHGPGVPMTKKPYIILCKNESEKEIETIVEELLKDYPEEFPNPKDSYIVQFMWNGVYFDNRILWKTV